MTALCAGGPSRVKAGIGPIQNLTAIGVEAVLIRLGMAWAAGLGPGLIAYSIITDDICATDPPVAPLIDAAWIAGFFSTFPSLSATRYAHDIEQLLAHYLWYDLCECASGAQPVAPPPLSQPPGYATDDPRLISPPGTPCEDRTPYFQTTSFNAAGNIAWVPVGGNAILPAAQWLQTRQSGVFEDSTTVGYPVTHTFTVSNATGAQLARTTWTQSALTPASNRTVTSLVLPPGSASFAYTSHTANTAGKAFVVDTQVAQYCTSPPASVLEPCCPPDPTISSMLAQIYRVEQEILAFLGSTVGYVKGLRHTGLQGTGSLAVTQPRGILVDVQTGVPTNPLLPGNPPYQWDLGWLTMLTGDGMILERRLTREHQLWIDSSFPLATTVGYFLNPGVVATITELQPA